MFKDQKDQNVFTGGEEGYPVYRIPSLLCTRKGTVLAAAEGRQSGTDQSENDLVLKRSLDGGATWEALQVLLSDGKSSYNNPCMAEDVAAGRILMMTQKFPDSTRPWKTPAGYEDNKSLKNYLIYSDDEGKSWSEPKDITRETKNPPPVTTIASGPGIGIQLKKGPFRGRIVFPINQGPFRKWKNYCTYSDDGGKTWINGTTVPDHLVKGGGNEVQVVELADGRLMLNTRSYGQPKKILFPNRRKKIYRRIAYSSDGGHSWTPMVDDENLAESRCMAGFIRYSGTGEKGDEDNILLFSNPATMTGRHTGTIRLSYDEGKSWPISKMICKGFFAYSSIAKVKGGKIAVLYETGKARKVERIKLASFDLGWLTG